MTKEFVWGFEMPISDFVLASEKYFKKPYWNLHEACCLVAKCDPEQHPGVGQGYLDWSEDDLDSENDYTRRPFIVALRCASNSPADLHIHGGHKLPLHIMPRKIETGKDVIVDSKVFVDWAVHVWPDGTKHLKAAYDEREARKAQSTSGYLSGKQKAGPTIKLSQQRQAFLEMLTELGGGAKTHSDRDLAVALAKRISEESFSAKSETLRKKIPKWRSEL